jgi:superfamily II helicase
MRLIRFCDHCNTRADDGVQVISQMSSMSVPRTLDFCEPCAARLLEETVRFLDSEALAAWHSIACKGSS